MWRESVRFGWLDEESRCAWKVRLVLAIVSLYRHELLEFLEPIQDDVYLRRDLGPDRGLIGTHLPKQSAIRHDVVFPRSGGGSVLQDLLHGHRTAKRKGRRGGHGN